MTVCGESSHQKRMKSVLEDDDEFEVHESLGASQRTRSKGCDSDVGENEEGDTGVSAAAR